MSKHGRTNYRRSAQGRDSKPGYRVTVESIRKEQYDFERMAKAALGFARAKANAADARAEVAEATTIAVVPPDTPPPTRDEAASTEGAYGA
ncbi:hypothetical protein [Nocardia mexicana]|uniref:Uncharacterized protein n=1 Tax=Nocardia mexicana TaxID=279262 RepID=A0A370HAQ7_9NOCA|nr:hypothetical protein [Nocardia mexicana]RDI54018.1 hypothetical protein DFR68_102139 [Nocardia mexicana]